MQESPFLHYCMNNEKLVLWKLINNKKNHNCEQGWGAGAGRSRVFLAPWSRSRLKKKQEPEPFGKKVRSPAGRKKHKETVLLLLFFR